MNTKSPCINICKYNSTGNCEGCGRTFEEVSLWFKMDDLTKNLINKEWLNKIYTVKNNIVLFQRGVLSQWYGAFDGQNSNFKEDGITFICAEQYMMYKKAVLFDDANAQDKILEEENAKKQQEIGRNIRNFDEQEWDKNKFNIVYKGNKLKFEQNENLKTFLIKTHPYILAEAAPWDKIWGIGLSPQNEKAYNIETWEGENLLGKVLMKVREQCII
jgi:ribA/ribD-fused uncharacterized protein